MFAVSNFFYEMIKFNLQGPGHSCNKAVLITTEVTGSTGSYNNLYNTSTHCVSLPAIWPGVHSCKRTLCISRCFTTTYTIYVFIGPPLSQTLQSSRLW